MKIYVSLLYIHHLSSGLLTWLLCWLSSCSVFCFPTARYIDSSVLIIQWVRSSRHANNMKVCVRVNALIFCIHHPQAKQSTFFPYYFNIVFLLEIVYFRRPPKPRLVLWHAAFGYMLCEVCCHGSPSVATLTIGSHLYANSIQSDGCAVVSTQNNFNV